MEAFWAMGYEACSMQDLLRVTGLSKSSLYHTFGSKRELYQRCLRRYRTTSAEHLQLHLDTSSSTRDFIVKTLTAAADEAGSGNAPRGCFVMNTAAEFAQTDSEVAKLVEESLSRIRTVYLEALRRGQESGEITRDRSAEELSNYLVTSMGGLRTMVKAGMDAGTVRSVVDIVIRALD